MPTDDFTTDTSGDYTFVTGVYAIGGGVAVPSAPGTIAHRSDWASNEASLVVASGPGQEAVGWVDPGVTIIKLAVYLVFTGLHIVIDSVIVAGPITVDVTTPYTVGIVATPTETTVYVDDVELVGPPGDFSGPVFFANLVNTDQQLDSFTVGGEGGGPEEPTLPTTPNILRPVNARRVPCGVARD